VVVKVDDKRHREDVPTVNTDWWNYGGLTRGVSLVEVPRRSSKNYFVQLKKGSTDTIAGWVKLNGGRARQQVTIRIPEAGVSASVSDRRQRLRRPQHSGQTDAVVAGESQAVRRDHRVGHRLSARAHRIPHD